MLFGRAQEEIAALEAAGVRYEVVPGITAALAAAADIGTSLTQRGDVRSFAFVTPRVGDGEPPSQWLDGMRGADAGAIYMGAHEAAAIAAALIAAGRAAATPVAIVEERVAAGLARALHDARRPAGVRGRVARRADAAARGPAVSRADAVAIEPTTRRCRLAARTVDAGDGRSPHDAIRSATASRHRSANLRAAVSSPMAASNAGGTLQMAAASRLPLFDLPPDEQRAWLARRLARPAPLAAQGLSDGFRLPGREGRTIPAAVLVPLVNRPQGLQLLLTQRSADLPDHPGTDQLPRRPARAR